MGGFRDLVRFIDNTHALGTHLGDIKLANILRNDQGIFSLIDQENASDVHTNPANIDWGTFTAEITTNALARALNPHNREFADRRAVLTISDQYATLLSLMIITAARASRIRDIASAPHRVDVFGGPHPGILNAEYRDALLPWVHTYIRPECYGSIEALLTDPLDYVQNPQYLPRLPLAQMIRWDAQ